MKVIAPTLAMIAILGLATAALAQDPPTGGADAKGNAPLKSAHTIDDGGAKKGANSFTLKEAQRHIMHSGFTDVSTLTKGKDGVWRGTANKDGVSMNVGLDFKGNVSIGGPVAPPISSTGSTTAAVSSTTKTITQTQESTTAPALATAGPVKHLAYNHRHHHWHHHLSANCADPGPNGVACSGKDRNGNGISDKEDRAIKAGDKP